jgi:hypothetical protein
VQDRGGLGRQFVSVYYVLGDDKLTGQIPVLSVQPFQFFFYA